MMQSLFSHNVKRALDYVKTPVLFKFGRMLKMQPALIAFIVQMMSLILVFLYAKLAYASINANTVVNLQFFLFTMVLLQASLTAAIASMINMEIWWRWIHFIFPIALWSMSILNIPTSVYFTGFVICLALYWTIFKTRVPFYPSRPAVWKALVKITQQHAHAKQGLRIIDIGSGLGDLSMHLAKTRKQDVVEGIEIAPLPWLISYIRASLGKSSASFTLGNYNHLDFKQYDVVFAYLSPAAMPDLWNKAAKQMRKGSMLISLEFEIPNQLPTQVVLPNKTSPKLYIWRF